MNSRYLLDTHCLIWFQENNPAIPEKVMQIIQNPVNTIFFSQISLYEITIKQKIGKLPLFQANTKDIFEQATADGFEFISVQNQHIYNYNSVALNEHHRDPFDRLLIATAQVENAAMVTADEKFKMYSGIINIIW